MRKVDDLAAASKPIEEATALEYLRLLGDAAAKDPTLPAGLGQRGNLEILQAVQRWLAREPIASGLSPQDVIIESLSTATAIRWRATGRPRFVLGDSIAALLTLTRAPSFQGLPYDAMVIEVPRKFFPASGPEGLPVWITLFEYRTGSAAEGNAARLLYFDASTRWQETATWGLVGMPEEMRFDEDDRGNVDLPWSDTSDQPEARLARRLILNVCAFVSQYRECLRSRPAGGRSAAAEMIVDVLPPREVKIDRAFRDHAASLVRDGSFANAKSVLRHVVRGHWKRQVSGVGRAERTLRWIEPYLRGSTDVGTVVDKVVRLDA